MVRVQRANVILDIKDEELDIYSSKGYSVIDENGNIIKKSSYIDPNDLMSLYKESSAENEKLKAEIERLKSEISKLKRATKSAK